MNRLDSGHPSDGDLLRFADGEIGGREGRKIRRHLGACWKCRTELAEIQKTIGECMQYRQTVLPQHLPEPPAQWFDIYRRMEALEETMERPSWAARAWETLAASVAQPRRWSVAAALVLIAVLVVDQLRNTPSVRAAELLEKATTAQELWVRAPRRIEIRTAGSRVTRVVGGDSPVSAAEQQTLDALEPRFERAGYNWDDPLSAASFASWRGSLADKRDEVLTVRARLSPETTCYRIRTTTDSGELLEATLDLTADGLRPVEGVLRFRDSQLVEMSDLGEVPAPPPSLAEVPAPLSEPARALPEPVVTPATPADELRVLAALRRLDADLGEPVEVRRDGARVTVTGVGVSPEISEQIEDELAGMPRVSVQLADPQPAPVPMAATEAPARTLAPRTGSSLYQAELAQKLGGTVAYEQFSNEALTMVDNLMARTHALRRLAEHFPPEVEAQLAPSDRRVLARLRQEHAVAVAGLAVSLEERSRPLLRSLGATDVPAQSNSSTDQSWQLATQTLFAQSRRSESLLAAMLGGATTEVPPGQLPTAALSSLAELRKVAAGFVRNALE